ncbi:SDR family NAD(P)-dependent oxidoreductase [Winogradskya humida]|nr:SDR family NAD(P)-dependent oxidoreductase [Actinoplanes humidus]
MKTWFITGASRGFGHVWARAALDRGDRVAATARNPRDLQDLSDGYGDRVLPLTLDVTDRPAVFAAVASAVAAFGGLDVVVNNAGYGLFGMVEEVTEEQARAQMETNFFGALWVTQAVLPVLRGQGRGHILQVSSIGGIGAFPTLGLYNASKWALEGLSEAVAAELAPLGPKVTIVEPGPFGTDWSGGSAVHGEPIAAYEPVREARRAGAAARTPAGPEVTAKVILQLVDAEEPPLRLFVGPYPYAVAEKLYRDRLATWNDWRWLAEQAG